MAFWGCFKGFRAIILHTFGASAIAWNASGTLLPFLGIGFSIRYTNREKGHPYCNKVAGLPRWCHDSQEVEGA